PSSFELRVLGAFSRHVVKGMKRVDTKTSNPGLLAAAFEDGAKSTLVVLNRSTEPQRLDVRWPGKQWDEVERTNLYSENAATVEVPKEIVVQPGEIVTLSTFSAN
ncbi:MAG TPA: glycoside hydrolase family 30 beta sandwich domain-containing protein, partial [Terracidiphilus sp.]